MERIKPKYGFWEVDHYPIGGCFRRAPVNGLELTSIGPVLETPYKGCHTYAVTADGRRVAISWDAIEHAGQTFVNLPLVEQ